MFIAKLKKPFKNDHFMDFRAPLKNPAEIFARIMEIIFLLWLAPEDTFTKEMLKEVLDNKIWWITDTSTHYGTLWWIKKWGETAFIELMNMMY